MAKARRATGSGSRQKNSLCRPIRSRGKRETMRFEPHFPHQHCSWPLATRLVHDAGHRRIARFSHFDRMMPTLRCSVLIIRMPVRGHNRTSGPSPLLIGPCPAVHRENPVHGSAGPPNVWLQFRRSVAGVVGNRSCYADGRLHPRPTGGHHFQYY